MKSVVKKRCNICGREYEPLIELPESLGIRPNICPACAMEMFAEILKVLSKFIRGV